MLFQCSTVVAAQRVALSGKPDEENLQELMLFQCSTVVAAQRVTLSGKPDEENLEELKYHADLSSTCLQWMVSCILKFVCYIFILVSICNVSTLATYLTIYSGL